jgi:hypothetical protein
MTFIIFGEVIFAGPAVLVNLEYDQIFWPYAGGVAKAQGMVLHRFIGDVAP